MIRMRSRTSEQQPLSCYFRLLYKPACMPSDTAASHQEGCCNCKPCRVLICMQACCAVRQTGHATTALLMTKGTRVPRTACAVHRYLRNITIPSAFITKSDGQTLKDLFKKSGSAQVDDVYVVLDWNDVLPRAQRVSDSS